MDGMALKANEILMRHQEYLKDSKEFRRTLENIDVMENWPQRKRMAKTPSVIIAPAGMLVGGLAVFYNEEIATKDRNGIAIVAFQIPGTPGRTLLEKGITLIRGKPKKVKAQVKRFDFSSHSGRKELFEMLKAVRGSPKVMTVHGEEEYCTKFAADVKEKFGFDAVAPSAGDVVKI
jgi:putative mRNA 3-end processing factor